MHKLTLLIFFCFSWFGHAAVQDDPIVPSREIIYDDVKRTPIDFDDSYIEELKKQEEFIYLEKKEVENWWTIFKQWIGNLWNSFLEWLFGDINASGFWAVLIELLPYLVMIGIFILIVWLFIKLNPGKSLMGSRDESSVFLSEDEKIIQSQNIEHLIEKAKENKDYRLAVRYYFLLILKRLIDRKVINYEMEKTNEDYLSEITNADWKREFTSLTHLYDFIWYGNFSISENEFFKVEKHFQKMESELKIEENG